MKEASEGDLVPRLLADPPFGVARFSVFKLQGAMGSETSEALSAARGTATKLDQQDPP